MFEALKILVRMELGGLKAIGNFWNCFSKYYSKNRIELSFLWQSHEKHCIILCLFRLFIGEFIMK